MQFRLGLAALYCTYVVDPMQYILVHIMDWCMYNYTVHYN